MCIRDSCSATPSDMDIGADTIESWHKTRGFREIGYHNVIGRGGIIEEGRDIDLNGAHTKGHNKNTIGVCLVGGVDKNNKPENNFTKAQFSSLCRLLRHYMVQYPNATIHGHREYANKACPSFDIHTFIKENL